MRKDCRSLRFLKFVADVMNILTNSVKHRHILTCLCCKCRFVFSNMVCSFLESYFILSIVYNVRAHTHIYVFMYVRTKAYLFLLLFLSVNPEPCNLIATNSSIRLQRRGFPNEKPRLNKSSHSHSKFSVD